MPNQITAPKGRERENPPAATHQAVCVRVLDMGTQPGSPAYPAEKRKYRLTFELSNEFDSEGEPFRVDKEYTFVDSEKSILRADWNSWMQRPKDDINMGEFLGKSALITIEHKKSEKTGKVYANVKTIVALPKGMKPLRPQSELEELHLIDGVFDEEVFNKLEKWIKEKVESSPEYKALGVDPAPADEEEEEEEVKQPTPQVNTSIKKAPVKPSAQLPSAAKAAVDKKAAAKKKR